MSSIYITSCTRLVIKVAHLQSELLLFLKNEKTVLTVAGLPDEGEGKKTIQHEYHDLRTTVLSLLPPRLYLLFTCVPAQNTNVCMCATVAPWKCMFRDYTHTHTSSSISLQPPTHNSALMHVDQGPVTLLVKRWSDCRGCGPMWSMSRVTPNPNPSQRPPVWNTSPSESPGSVRAFVADIATSAHFI